MKIIVNFFLIILIGVIVYLLLVFVSPETSSKIDSAIGMPELSDSIRGKKIELDTAITDIPSVNEFQQGANDIKDTVVNGIQTTKDTIDTIRSSGQVIEESYNTVIDTYDQARDIVNTAGERIEDIQQVAESINKLSGNTSNVESDTDTGVETEASLETNE